MNDVKKQIHDLIDAIPEGEEVLQLVFESLAVYNSKTPIEITDELNLSQLKRLKDSITKSSLAKNIPGAVMREEIKKWSSK